MQKADIFVENKKKTSYPEQRLFLLLVLWFVQVSRMLVFCSSCFVCIFVVVAVVVF